MILSGVVVKTTGKGRPGMGGWVGVLVLVSMFALHGCCNTGKEVRKGWGDRRRR